MTTNILRTGVNNYFINEDGSISMQYDPYFNKCFMMFNGEDNPKINISMDKISIQTGGQIVFKFNSQKYIIDDGYRNKLIMAGYLTNTSSYEGTEMKLALIDVIKSANLGNDNGNSIIISKEASGYHIECIIETLNKMIDRNIKRSELKLPMYPTERGLSKQSSLYFRIFAQKSSSAKISKSLEELHIISNHMIKSIVDSVHFDWSKVNELDPDNCNEFSIKECRIRRTIIKWEEDL